MDLKNYYKILEIDDYKCEKSLIKAQYKKLSLKYHPDKNSNESDRFCLINEAYEILADNEKRKEYDKLYQYHYVEGNKPSDDVYIKLFNIFLSNLKTFVQNKILKHEYNVHKTLSVNLDEIYNKKEKRLYFSRKKNTKESETLFVDIKLESILDDVLEFDDLGNYYLPGKYGKLMVKIEYEQVLHKNGIMYRIYNDVDLFIQKEMTLYDGLIVKELDLDLFESDILMIKDDDFINKNVFKIAGKGFPIGETRSDVIVKIKLKTNFTNHDLEKIRKICYNEEF